MHPAGFRDVLKNLPLFSGLEGSALTSVGAAIQQRSCRRRALIIETGDHATGLYVIVSGKVRLFVDAGDGRELTLGALPAGDFFGEACIVNGAVHVTNVEAEDPCELAFIPREALQRFVLTHAAAASAMLAKVVARLSAAQDRAARLGLMNVYGRVVCAIIESVREANGEHVVEIGSEGIAALVGASREMVSRVVRDLIDREIVERRKRKLIVLNREALAAQAALERGKLTHREIQPVSTVAT